MEKETDNRDNLWQYSMMGCFWLHHGHSGRPYVAATAAAGCSTTKYVTVPEVHHDTVRVTQQQRDSIYLHDLI